MMHDESCCLLPLDLVIYIYAKVHWPTPVWAAPARLSARSVTDVQACCWYNRVTLHADGSSVIATAAH